MGQLELGDVDRAKQNAGRKVTHKIEGETIRWT